MTGPDDPRRSGAFARAVGCRVPCSRAIRSWSAARWRNHAVGPPTTQAVRFW